jgi:hypothetical protein
MESSLTLATDAAGEQSPGFRDTSRPESLIDRLAHEMFKSSDPNGASCYELPGFASDATGRHSPGVPNANRPDDLSARLAGEMPESPDPSEVSRYEAFLTDSFHIAAPPFVLKNDRDQRLRVSAEGEVLAFEVGHLASQPCSSITALPSLQTLVPQVKSITSDLPEVGETIGEFRLLASLGKGVRGFVFLADQPSLANRPVVLKFTPRDGREHLSLAQLRHQSIVPLYYVQDLPERNLRLLCMPYLGGSPLGRLLNHLGEISLTRTTGRDILFWLDRDQASIPIAVPNQGPARQFLFRASYVQTVCWIGACLADALQFAHERGLVHLDLKPSNILLAADGTPMLLDFHLSQPPIRPTEASKRWLGGTPKYMSPEQRVAMTAPRPPRDHRRC